MPVLSLPKCKKMDVLGNSYAYLGPSPRQFIETQDKWITGANGYCTVKSAKYVRHHPTPATKVISAYNTTEMLDFLPHTLKINGIEAFLRITKNTNRWFISYINDDYEYRWPSFEGAYLCEVLGDAVIFVLETLIAAVQVPTAAR